MKQVFFALLITTTLFSCKKDIQQSADHEKGWYRVLAIGKDTSISSSMYARTETVGLVIAEDDKLKAVLTSYQPLPGGQGIYTVDVTNKQNGNVIIRWGWDGLRIDNVSPASDVVPANQTVTFILTGDAKVGKIKLQADCPHGRDCNNSSTLIINVSMAILPISYIENTATYDVKSGKVIISFTIDDPSQIDQIIIQKQDDNNWKEAALILCDKVTKSYNVKL